MAIPKIKTDNKLIAEFLGYPTKNFWWHHPTPEIPNGLPMSLTDSICKFHKSLDWLIVVINKIQATGLQDYPLWTAACRQNITTPIEILHKNVVAFIKWYNENITTLSK